MVKFNFERWFADNVDVNNTLKKEALKLWMLERDLNTVGALTGGPIVLPADKVWATEGIQSSINSAIASLKTSKGLVSVLNNEVIEEIVDRIAKRIKTEEHPSQTLATVGLMELTKMKNNNRDFIFTAVEGSKSVLNKREYKNLQKSNVVEHDVVQMLQIKFTKMFPNFAVVSSEIFPWLLTLGRHQKPDLFICPISFYKKRYAKNEEGYPPGYRYGVVDDKSLYHSVVLLDCKCTLTHESFGELIAHMQHLSIHSGDSSLRGMLFGKREFWLYEQINKISIQRIVGKYTDAGSVDLIKDFFKPVLAKYNSLNGLCNAVGVELVDPELFPALESGFLGKGGFGSVVRVYPKNTSVVSDEHLIALKFTDIKHEAILNAELSLLLKHKENCNCELIVTPISTKIIKVNNLCGFVMKPVGYANCSKQMIYENEISVSDILNALFCLHTHPVNIIIHGDPRLQNLICIKSRIPNNINKINLCWIDLMNCVMEIFNPTTNIQEDMKKLVNSIIGESGVKNTEIQNLIYKYAKNPNKNSVKKLAMKIDDLLRSQYSLI